MAELQSQHKSDEQQIQSMHNQLASLEQQNLSLQQEVQLYKGKCQSLAREVELNFNQLSKTSTVN
jgi:predicted RNase H-like nuclease (RuvC/YqgF family)